ncbi:hypothetical protein Salat_2124700 [Sesamum alatum]|uniref:Uncharacterized protein n=1 Tax=Sesamum alatum TaxID=300844 RepID=A0AAE1Y1W7_9LAMI|nr:hypothetical protein Salat_2124700 [Sesamum alatum]
MALVLSGGRAWRSATVCGGATLTQVWGLAEEVGGIDDSGLRWRSDGVTLENWSAGEVMLQLLNKKSPRKVYYEGGRHVVCWYGGTTPWNEMNVGPSKFGWWRRGGEMGLGQSEKWISFFF